MVRDQILKGKIALPRTSERFGAFNPSDIDISTRTPSIDTLIKRMKYDEIELDTSTYFQRKSGIWESDVQSRLIESILVRFPLPAFYFDGSDSKKWLVVDGLQRLISIKKFVLDKTLKLEGLEFLPHLNNLRFDELSRDDQRLIEEAQVVIYVINPGTPIEVKFNIFRRINTGGLFLKPMEIRNALFQGIPIEFVRELASNEIFKSLTDSMDKKGRMEGHDLVNRFLAFFLFGINQYQKGMDQFLNGALSVVEVLSESELRQIKEAFVTSMHLNDYLFGRHSFRKSLAVSENKALKVNKALFDIFSVSFAKVSEYEIIQIKNKKDRFLQLISNVFEHDDTFVKAITIATSDVPKVRYRFEAILGLLDEIIG